MMKNIVHLQRKITAYAASLRDDATDRVDENIGNIRFLPFKKKVNDRFKPDFLADLNN